MVLVGKVLDRVMEFLVGTWFVPPVQFDGEAGKVRTISRKEQYVAERSRYKNLAASLVMYLLHSEPVGPTVLHPEWGAGRQGGGTGLCYCVGHVELEPFGDGVGLSAYFLPSAQPAA